MTDLIHIMVEGGGFEPPKLSRQIYSLIPLTAREPLRREPDIVVIGHSPVNLYFGNMTGFFLVYPQTPTLTSGRKGAGV